MHFLNTMYIHVHVQKNQLTRFANSFNLAAGRNKHFSHCYGRLHKISLASCENSLFSRNVTSDREIQCVVIGECLLNHHLNHRINDSGEV